MFLRYAVKLGTQRAAGVICFGFVKVHCESVRCLQLGKDSICRKNVNLAEGLFGEEE